MVQGFAGIFSLPYSPSAPVAAPAGAWCRAAEKATHLARRRGGGTTARDGLDSAYLSRELLSMSEMSGQRLELRVFKRCGRESIIGFVLGGVPVMASSQSTKALDGMINTLLTASPLMWYYLVLLAVFCIAGLLRFKSDRPGKYQKGLLKLCRFLGDLGTPFLSATRTAAGAFLGFAAVCCFIKPEAFNLKGVLLILTGAAILIAFSAFLAAVEEILKDPRGTSTQD